jgi:hypothetical protein
MEECLDPSIDRVKGRTGKWAEGEDIKLKHTVERHGGKNWVAITSVITHGVMHGIPASTVRMDVRVDG